MSFQMCFFGTAMQQMTRLQLTYLPRRAASLLLRMIITTSNYSGGLLVTEVEIVIFKTDVIRIYCYTIQTSYY